ncbi:glycosyltransferase family 39 protein [Acinetobacter indicus]|uniref:glycosyltransferase family 39 protein n=1 Tax=Acinetobacter indicus TaxID=756892 RepID=UPI001443CA13|nr:glycosyltransferase family 39 protein [Acinetobacter indicus]
MLEFDFYQNNLTLLFLIISFIIVFIFGSKSKADIKVISILFFWHTAFSILYFYFTLYNAADAINYYRMSLTDNINFYPGSPFLYFFSSIFSKGIDANYLNVTLVYNLFGALGLVFLYLSLKKYFKSLSRYWVLILFIPSMSFWSAGLGKDAISFFSVCLFLYAITSNKNLYFLLPISFFFMFMVRPHIALMMIVSFVIYFILRSRVHLLVKLITLPVIIAGVVVSSGFVQQYVGLDEASLDSVSAYVDDRQNFNQGGGSSIDLQSMSYPVQMFTYVFRPLPFDAHSALALFTSIENTILLILFLYVLFKNKFRLNYFIEGKNAWLLIYAFLTCSMLAITTANLGIATRQKWMFMPILIYLLVYAFYRYKQSQHTNSTKK